MNFFKKIFNNHHDESAVQNDIKIPTMEDLSKISADFNEKHREHLLSLIDPAIDRIMLRCAENAKNGATCCFLNNEDWPGGGRQSMINDEFLNRLKSKVNIEVKDGHCLIWWP